METYMAKFITRHDAPHEEVEYMREAAEHKLIRSFLCKYDFHMPVVVQLQEKSDVAPGDDIFGPRPGGMVEHTLLLDLKVMPTFEVEMPKVTDYSSMLSLYDKPLLNIAAERMKYKWGKFKYRLKNSALVKYISSRHHKQEVDNASEHTTSGKTS